MSNIQAAIGCAQIERIEDLIARKREILAFYKSELEILEGVSMNPEAQGTINGAWMPTIVFAKETGITREKLQDVFKKENIDARVFFYPLSSFPMFEDRKENVNSWDIPTRAINLPSYHEMSLEDQKTVLKLIKNIDYDS